MINIFMVIAFLAIVFDFLNGFHDAANSIATIVSTKVLTPLQAVLWAALWNVVAFFIFTNHNVAGTIAHIIDSNIVDLRLILAGVVAAILWNLLTWWLGIPSSSSHTLIGGLIGAGIAKAGTIHVIDMPNLLKTVAFIFLSPIIGMILAFIFTMIVNWVCRKSNPYKAESWFKRLQLVSSAAFSLGHGGNDAQKSMGLIAIAAYMYHGITIPEKLDFIGGPINLEWIPMACYIAMGCGTMFGGWKIVKTMGTKITKVTPLEGVTAELAAASTLILTEVFGIPVSTTHTIAGAIMGVGATKRLSAVRWGVTVSLMWAWVLTIPVSAIVAAIVYWVSGFFL